MFRGLEKTLDVKWPEDYIPSVMTGAQIRAAREAAGLTQVELARQLGVTSESVNRWENGRLKLRRTSVIALSTVLPALGKVLPKPEESKTAKSKQAQG